MTATAIPASVDEITPAWLTDALQARHPGALVADVDVISRSEVTNSHARLDVSYNVSAGAPRRLFCKLLPNDGRRASVAATRMGAKEVRFYRDLAPSLKLRVPSISAALVDDADESFVLLMEDLALTGCTVSDGTWGLGPDAAAGALTDLAELHARFEDPVRRLAEAPWITEPKYGSTYGSTMLQYALDHHRERVSAAFASIANLYIREGRALFDLWTSGPKTVIHGDTHIGNLFFENGRVGFLDWGLITLNTPLREVSYLLTMGMNIEDRRTGESDLLRHYLGERLAFGALPIAFDHAWTAYRIHAAYCVVASCQIVTFPEGISEGRRVFSDAFLARAESAIGDLDSMGALTTALEV